MNLGAVVRYGLKQGRDIVIIPSGREGEFSLEDAACAGGIVEMIGKPLHHGAEITDAARASEILYGHFKGDLVGMFRSSVHGSYLIEIGLESDLEYCARRDVTALVPVYRDGKIDLSTGATPTE